MFFTGMLPSQVSVLVRKVFLVVACGGILESSEKYSGCAREQGGVGTTIHGYTVRDGSVDPVVNLGPVCKFPSSRPLFTLLFVRSLGLIRNRRVFPFPSPITYLIPARYHCYCC